jgi:hypothetical protein
VVPELLLPPQPLSAATPTITNPIRILLRVTKPTLELGGNAEPTRR